MSNIDNLSYAFRNLRKSITEPVVIDLGDGLKLDIPPAGPSKISIIKEGLGHTSVSYGEDGLELLVHAQGEIVPTSSIFEDNDDLMADTSPAEPLLYQPPSIADMAAEKRLLDNETETTPTAMQCVAKLVEEALSYNQQLDESEAAPTGDDYNRLLDIFDALKLVLSDPKLDSLETVRLRASLLDKKVGNPAVASPEHYQQLLSVVMGEHH